MYLYVCIIIYAIIYLIVTLFLNSPIFNFKIEPFFRSYRYTIYSPKDGQPCMDHDRQTGEVGTVFH